MQYTVCLILKYWLLHYWQLSQTKCFILIDPSETQSHQFCLFFFSHGFVLRTWVISPFFTLHTCFYSSNLGEAQRVCHSQVPVQRYTAEEGDADVDISIENEAKQLATLLTMDPIIMLQEVVDPQRKSGDVEEVSHWQVDQVDAELVPLTHLEGGMWWREGEDGEERWR